MRKLRTAVALAASLALAACQTLDGVTVNGVDLSNNRVEQAQANTGVCGNTWVCLVLAAAVIGGGAWLIWGGGDDDDVE